MKSWENPKNPKTLSFKKYKNIFCFHETGKVSQNILYLYILTY